MKVPQEVTVEGYEDRVVIRWASPYDEADEYAAEIERAEDGGGFLLLGTVALNAGSFLDQENGLQFDVPYRYRIRTVSAQQKTSAWVESESVVIEKPVYAPPAKCIAALTRDQQGIRLSWEVAKAADRTVVIERTSAEEPFTEVARVAEKEGMFIDKDLQDETVYRYRAAVLGDERGRQSAWSRERTVTYAVKRFAPVSAAAATVGNTGMNKWGATVTWLSAPLSGKGALRVKRTIEIERKTGAEEFAPLASALEDKGKFIDTTVEAGNDLLEEQNGCEVRGSVYTYRIRYGAAEGFAASAWSETAPVTFAFPYFKAPVVRTGPGKTASSISVMWDDMNPAYDPNGKLERSTDAGPFKEIARVQEADKEYEDRSVARGKQYSYRLQWQAESGVRASAVGGSGPASAVDPAYALPEDLAIGQREKAGGAAEVVITWGAGARSGKAVLEIERSDNSRDFITLGKVALQKGVFVDTTVSAHGGSPRVVNGKDVLLNVYRYRLRVQGDTGRQPSAWHEFEDIFVLGPA